MKKIQKDEIYLTVNNFLLRFNNNVPFKIPFNSLPKCEVSCEPQVGVLELRIFAKIQKHFKFQKKEISFKIENTGNRPCILIQLQKKDLFEEFYRVCLQIIEQVQIQRKSPFKAITSVFLRYEELLKAKKEIPEEKVIGLWGELYFIHQMLSWKRGENIIHNWFGHSNEEHDFVTKKNDYEVKTTRSERRIHTIASLSQLYPKPKRKLFLISIQITNSLQEEGESIISLIDKINKKLKNPKTNEIFSGKIKSFSVDKMNAEIVDKKFILRSNICIALVDSGFPKITFKNLKVKSSAKNRIIDCTYKINVENLGSDLVKNSYE